MIMQAEISNTRGEGSSWGNVTPIAFLPSSFRSPPVGPQYIMRPKLLLYEMSFHVYSLLHILNRIHIDISWL